MAEGSNYRNCLEPICSKIRSLLISLTEEPSQYEQIASKTEFWIEYVLRQRFVTVSELAEGVSGVGWESGGSYASVGRFLKEFHGAPHRSEQAKSFVVQLCPEVLRWFAIASVEDFWLSSGSGRIAIRGAPGFIRAASFVGHLIEWGLLSHDLVRQHLIKPLINQHNNCEHSYSAEAVRVNAIYQLFTTAGDTLLQGLLEAEDVQVCFQALEFRREWIDGFDPVKLQV